MIDFALRRSRLGAAFFVSSFLSGKFLLFPVLIVARKKPLTVVGYCRDALANSESDFDFETPELLRTEHRKTFPNRLFETIDHKSEL